jgi:hypothetical protein
MFCEVSLWIVSDNDNGGYWNRFEVASLLEAKAYTSTHKHNWAIRPLEYDGRNNPQETTWMIALVGESRIGACELWAQYDETTPSEIVLLPSHLVTESTYTVEQHKYGNGHAQCFLTIDKAREYATKIGDNFKAIRKDTYSSEYVS